jgi:hypothetical protein
MSERPTRCSRCKVRPPYREKLWCEICISTHSAVHYYRKNVALLGEAWGENYIRRKQNILNALLAEQAIRKAESR